MATNLPPPSVNPASDATTRFVQLRTEIEDKFTDLHQMLDVRRQQLLDKLTELEEIHDEYVKHTETIHKLTSAITNMKEIVNDNDIPPENAQQSVLTILQQQLEDLEKDNVKFVNIDYLTLIDNKHEFLTGLNSISISDSKIAFEYSNRTAPTLSKVSRGTKKGEILHPAGICIDDDMKEVYICDVISAHGSRIHVFSLEGVFIRKFGKDHLPSPCCIALSSSNVFVTNSIDSHCLMKFNKAGTFAKRAGLKGSGDGQFNWPQGLCVANALVYVCDGRNNRIQVFDFNLRYIFKFTSESLTNPQGIEHYSNQLFVSKQTGNTIFVYSLDGTYIKSIQLTGEGSPLNYAYHFTLDLSGNYLFSEYVSNCIKIFSSTGEYVASLGNQHLQSPKGLAINKQSLNRIVCVSSRPHAVFQTF